jgi:hypothetical protein
VLALELGFERRQPLAPERPEARGLVRVGQALVGERDASLIEMSDDGDTGVCGADVPSLIGEILTGTGLTLAQAASAIERGETPPLTPVQRRIVEDWVSRA